MLNPDSTNYARIASAIDYINLHFKNQPSLNEIASAVHLSPFHFQRLFSQWAGVSPKTFLQYLSVEYAKTLLLTSAASLVDTAYATGLSSTSRLHDLFVNIEGMTPGEFKHGGASLVINYSFVGTPFGQLLVASTSKGVCHMLFADHEPTAFAALMAYFPHAQYRQAVDKFQQDALLIFQQDWSQLDSIKLHLNGTAFQLKVWASLLKIPLGNLTTYGAIAQTIGNPKAFRAVGTAIGANPVAFLIPCHRVIQGSGSSGGYRWGPTRKSALIGWEAARINAKHTQNGD